MGKRTGKRKLSSEVGGSEEKLGSWILI